MCIRHGARAHAKLRAHLFVDTLLELSVKVNDWLKDFPRIRINHVKLIIAGIGAIILDVLGAGDTWSHQESAEHHEHDRKDEENDHGEGHANAVHRQLGAAREQNAHDREGDHDAAEEHYGFLLLDF